jgi:acyl-CoA reductase-like NAD-dependent aldehyde dehydrogenase
MIRRVGQALVSSGAARKPCPLSGEAVVLELRNLVDGQWRDGSGEVQRTVNPARPEEPVATFRAATEDEADETVAAARRAARAWTDTPMHERADVLVRAAALLDARAEALGAELTREEGKTLPEGIGEVRRAADILRYHAGEASRDAGEIYNSPRRGESIMVVRQPVGVVTVITPWNFPIAIPAWKIAPALVHGNAVVWKPASLVPLLAYRFTEALVEAGIPAGVLSLVLTGGRVGQRLVEDSRVDAVTFTGSTDIGRRLMVTCAELLKPIQTEMGGKNAAVVLRDAPLDLAAEQVVLGAMRSTGQKCTATSRLIVEEAVADELLELLCGRVASLRVGDGLEPGVDMGPAASEDAQASIMAAIEEARAQGAEVLAGGAPYSGDAPGAGWFVPPTVLAVPDRSVNAWREEIFGPVLSVLRAPDTASAIDMANDSRFGLSGAVFTNDLGRALDAIAHFDAGILHINSETAGADPHVPFGGMKQSGSGAREQGRAAREFFTHSKTVYLRPLG